MVYFPLGGYTLCFFSFLGFCLLVSLFVFRCVCGVLFVCLFSTRCVCPTSLHFIWPYAMVCYFGGNFLVLWIFFSVWLIGLRTTSSLTPGSVLRNTCGSCNQDICRAGNGTWVDCMQCKHLTPEISLTYTITHPPFKAKFIEVSLS